MMWVLFESGDEKSDEESYMSHKDTCCTLVPYFKIHPGHIAAFKKGCEKFVERTLSEPKCMFYGFSFCGDEAHCREGYEDADAVLRHLDNVGELLEEALKISDIIRLEVHAPESEISKLKEPLSSLNPQFFSLEFGFRR
jgi:quinol monooxygenase YgiN